MRTFFIIFCHIATTLDSDSVVLDFEDGVSMGRKEIARELIPNALKLNWGRSERCVRINSFTSDLLIMDLESLIPVLDYVDSVLLPKVENKNHVLYLSDFLEKYENKETKVVSTPHDANSPHFHTDLYL
eukprot:TRINITY_DN5813_c0_g2_i4.p1 TRINITY_DN5813_c0_g2~~TRINITY_DN5813_c0_g2_i4.p1  ORF type:complete len:129 (-),score=10.82 TRINITY_DN5813_c0_g2_i4:295-681(-)